MAQVVKDEIQIEEEGTEENANESEKGGVINTDDFDRVICIGVDGSPQAELAFRYYMENLHHNGNLVVFIHAFELPILHSFQEMYVSPETWENTLRHEADNTHKMEERLTGIMKECGVPCRFIARGGKPGEVIVLTAEELNADLIVVGTRGHGKLRRALMGSVSGYVNNHAHCAVLVSRPKGRCRVDSRGSIRTRSDSSSSNKIDETRVRRRNRNDSQRSIESNEDEEERKKPVFSFRLPGRKRNMSTSSQDEAHKLHDPKRDEFDDGHASHQ